MGLPALLGRSSACLAVTRMSCAWLRPRLTSVNTGTFSNDSLRLGSAPSGFKDALSSLQLLVSASDSMMENLVTCRAIRDRTAARNRTAADGLNVV